MFTCINTYVHIYDVRLHHFVLYSRNCDCVLHPHHCVLPPHYVVCCTIIMFCVAPSLCCVLHHHYVVCCTIIILCCTLIPLGCTPITLYCNVILPSLRAVLFPLYILQHIYSLRVCSLSVCVNTVRRKIFLDTNKKIL